MKKKNIGGFMNIVKERRKQGAVCCVCRSPDYSMTPVIPGETTKPNFTCNGCGHSWAFGYDGGKYAILSTPNAVNQHQEEVNCE